MNTSTSPAPVSARRLLLSGRVQGVGFRPFVYRLAHGLELQGWVRNQRGKVAVHIEGPLMNVFEFRARLLNEAPPLARPQLEDDSVVEVQSLTDFTILDSSEDDAPVIHVPPDWFTCDDCLRELHTPTDRRYRYPFINCTQCGPRYTLIRALPYDRANTSMAGFALCPACNKEYHDPLDRRYHAEPIACPTCGPQLEWHFPGQTRVSGNEVALDAAIAALRRGAIVAVKGIGGYHLMCDAGAETTVQRLRESKPRPHKPLALMFPATGPDQLEAVRAVCRVDEAATALLTSPMRPIVLLPRHNGKTLSSAIAPRLYELGVMLPYSPLHHLLLNALGKPLVATSANIYGEPVITDNREVEQRLAHVAEAFLHHDRPIERPADDSVWRPIAGRVRPLRLGRGCAPLEFALPFNLPRPLLAVGGHMKNTIALAWDNRVVISPHIGDLDAPRSLDVFARTAADLQQLYAVQAELIACDAHPGYGSSRWAANQPLERIEVFHHRAHASALAGEFPEEPRWLVFTWDGVGLGEDNTLWGGEALYGAAGDWRRVASMRPFHLPGGDKAGRQPWRAAAALCWECGQRWDGVPDDAVLLYQAWTQRLNSPATSAVGRLFDAAAALTGLVSEASFEGQGPMYLEACATSGETPIELPLASDETGILRSDWAPLLSLLRDKQQSVVQRAGIFHASMAAALVAQAGVVRQARGEFAVGLTGGVFQNRLLAERCLDELRAAGFRAYLPAAVPCNDAGLSFGQVIEAGAGMAATR
ncbi:MAG: carbamoyltransferase HypF [Gammaproteobacteria bacterium]